MGDQKKPDEEIEEIIDNSSGDGPENENGGIKIEDGPEEDVKGKEVEDATDDVENSSGDKKADPEAADEEAEADSHSEADDNESEDENSGDAKDEINEGPKERKLNWAKKGNSSKKASAEDKIKAQLDEANDKYARLFAEFDNFRKRSEKEKAERYDLGAKDVIEKILPVLDNFERGFDSVEESDKDDAFVTGMDLVYKQFLTVLEDMGVKPIEAVGCEFNPDFHNAVMHIDDDEAGENIIVEEFQKGYTYKDQIVRYSMVKVAN